MTITTAKIGDLTPDENNANKGTERGRYALEKSLTEYGFGRSILIDKNGHIIAGNKTHQVAGEIGLEDVIVVQSDGQQVIAVQRTDLDISDLAARELAIADNRVGQLDLEWDADALKELEEAGADLRSFWTDAELDAIYAELTGEPAQKDEAEEDEAPDVERVSVRAGVELGSIWQLGRHYLLCGDSTNKAEIDRLLNAAGVTEIELIFTSPPYSDLRTYDGADCSISHLSKIFGAWGDWTNYFAVNLGLKFKDGAVVPYWNDWIADAQSDGLKMLAWNVWDKTVGGSVASATNMFLLTHEWIFVFGERRKKLIRTVPNQMDKYEQRWGANWQDGKVSTVRQADGSVAKTSTETYTHHQLHSVIQKTPEYGEIRVDHPAVMPVGLPAQYIEAMTTEDQVVADCFMGSGTTLMACQQLGRICLGSEISPKYFEVILQRWENYTGEVAKRVGEA